MISLRTMTIYGAIMRYGTKDCAKFTNDAKMQDAIDATVPNLNVFSSSPMSFAIAYLYDGVKINDEWVSFCLHAASLATPEQ